MDKRNPYWPILTLTIWPELGEGFALELPCDPFELDEILAEQGVFRRGGYEVDNDYTHARIMPESCVQFSNDLEELNYLAAFFGRRKYNTDQYDQILTAMGGGAHNAVDLATHYEGIVLYADIFTHRDLGVEFLKGKTTGDTEYLSDHSLVQWGKYAQQQMGGIFMENGMFVGFPKELLRNRYDGHVLPSYYTNTGSGVELAAAPQAIGIVKPISEEYKNISVKREARYIPMPLYASAATQHRILSRLNVDFHRSIFERSHYRFYRPDAKRKDITSPLVAGTAGQVWQAAIYYDHMTEPQREAFRDIMRKQDRDEDLRAIRGDTQKPVSTGDLIERYGVWETMEQDHGFVRPTSQSPVTLVVRNRRHPELITQTTMPADQEEMDTFLGAIAALEPEEYRGFEVLTFSIDANCRAVEQIIEETPSPVELNERIGIMLQEAATQAPTESGQEETSHGPFCQG